MSSKTQRRIYENLDVSGAVALGFYEKNFKTLANDAENSLKRPWHKLERGLRIGRIREFVAREVERLKMDSEDSDALFKLLIKALDRKLLNSKAAVTYDLEGEKITEIKGLVSHTSALNKTKFQILEKKPAATQKKRAATPQAQAAGISAGTVAQPLTEGTVPKALKELPPVNSSEVKNETQPTQ
jgi:hypothetical protein